MIDPRSRGVLDPPAEPIIGLAEGETRWRGMTSLGRRCCLKFKSVTSNAPDSVGSKAPLPSPDMQSSRISSARSIPAIEEVVGLVLPALDADVPDSDRWRDAAEAAPSAAASGEIDIRFRISEALEKALNPPRHSGRHEGARAEQVVFAPSGHARRRNRSAPKAASRRFPTQQEILRNVFAGQDHRRRVHRNERRRVGKQIVQPVEKFLRQSETLVPRPASLDLPAHELPPSAARCGQVAGRNALHLRNGRADMAEDALFLVFRQPGHGLVPRMPCSRVMTRYGHWSRSPSSTISGIGTPSRPRKLRQRGPLRDELLAQQRRKNLQHQPPSRATTRLVPVGEHVRRRHAAGHGCARYRAPPAAIVTRRCARRWKAAIVLTIGSECMMGNGFRKSVRSREVWTSLAIRAGALELAQQAVAALDRGIQRGLRGFLAAEGLLQLVVDHIADQDERPEPDAPANFRSAVSA